MHERKLYFGIEDIRGMCLECRNCKTRVRLGPEKLRLVPEKCPGCSEEWMPLHLDQRQTPIAPYHSFAIALHRLREAVTKDNGDLPYRILIEYDEPKD